MHAIRPKLWPCNIVVQEVSWNDQARFGVSGCWACVLESKRGCSWPPPPAYTCSHATVCTARGISDGLCTLAYIIKLSVYTGTHTLALLCVYWLSYMGFYLLKVNWLWQLHVQTCIHTHPTVWNSQFYLLTNQKVSCTHNVYTHLNFLSSLSIFPITDKHHMLTLYIHVHSSQYCNNHVFYNSLCFPPTSQNVVHTLVKSKAGI